MFDYRHLLELNEIEKFLRTHLSAVFFENTVEEWVGTYLLPVKKKLQEVIQTADEQIHRNSRFVDEAMEISKKAFTPYEMDC